MNTRRQFPLRNNGYQAKKSIVPSVVRLSQRGRRLKLGSRDTKDAFSPPEDWHEPTEGSEQYRIIVQDPGPGYQHILTPDQVRNRLAELPPSFLRALEFVQFSRMTRKKQSFPCYGMQWGATLYLYPLEESREELFFSPPRPEVVNEAKMYGGRWDRPDDFTWRLSWSEKAIQDYYLNNILIHELGHLLDNRNSNYTDRERYAEWFAIQYGYLASGGRSARRKAVRRRHHGS
ncbi:hypothetical protein [Bythopirellula polymerisocia]|uniref:Uncharacterized protein n=1 Tax=Bythopirellula polymerisocia TaxID=2528003 RepID=A0A5C6CSJ9_9BACT|nr:hypothetical protein [Bythopirellula polymerisocia]TWU27358.1 hypothetical protein Pla144_21300 [Bythopirellula polymerisocia]